LSFILHLSELSSRAAHRHRVQCRRHRHSTVSVRYRTAPGIAVLIQSGTGPVLSADGEEGYTLTPTLLTVERDTTSSPHYCGGNGYTPTSTPHPAGGGKGYTLMSTLLTVEMKTPSLPHCWWWKRINHESKGRKVSTVSAF